MSSTGEEGSSTSQAFTAFWMAGPESPATPIVGNPVANPVTDLANLTAGEIVPASVIMQQSNLTTMSNAVPQDEFGHTPSASINGEQQVVSENVTATVHGHAEQINEHTLVSVVNASDTLLSSGQPQQIHVRLTSEHTEQQNQSMQSSLQQHSHNIQQQHIEQKYFPVSISKSEDAGTTEIVISPSLPSNSGSNSNSNSIGGQHIPNNATLTITGINTSEIDHHSHQQPQSVTSQAGASTPTTKKKSKNVNNDGTVKPMQRRRLSGNHREMIIDLVFNEKKTSREVARYMALPQSTVMSVVKVFKLEHRIHKKTATGRKRRLMTQQEFALYEMSLERDNISVDEIRSRFLRLYPQFQHISKTTIYRTIERGKKGLIGMDPIPNNRYLEPVNRYQAPKRKPANKTKQTASIIQTNPILSQSTSIATLSANTIISLSQQSSNDNNLSLQQDSHNQYINVPMGTATFRTIQNNTNTNQTNSITVQQVQSSSGSANTSSTNDAAGCTSLSVDMAEPSIIIDENVDICQDNKEVIKQRRSLSIAEREMIISLFFNENRTVREVADVMKLAKSTVSSVVQVFKKEHRIQRKTSTGRKKKLSENHLSNIIEILTEKDDITIEETRNKFLSLNPEVPNISKSTIYRVMETYQTKLKARSDMEVFVGTIVNSTDTTPMVVQNQMVIGVINGKIEFVESIEELDQLKAEYVFTDGNITYLTNNQFLMPGLIDTHTHASQFPNNGLAMDLPLLEWLQTYTFPTEAKFVDTEFAREVYNTVVTRLIRNGTTTASYYATIHLEASKILADIVKEKGQRALVGKVNMVRNCPEYYREHSVQQSLHETEEFIRYVRDLQSPLVLPIITPRFAPTCPEDQLLSLGQLASKTNCHIQTHLCETKPECNWVKELFPWAKNYTEVYDRMRLLTEKTIVAHCVYTSPSEISLLAEKGAGVSHCPNSNISLKSGHCDVRALMNGGLQIGLGTDCSGGYSTSMLDAVRKTVQVSACIAIDRSNQDQGQEEYSPISHKEAFRMATLGGAKVLNMEDKIGSLDIDKDFDALLIDVKAPNSPLDIYLEETMESKVDKFLYNGDDRNIMKVFVAGTKILDNYNVTLLPNNETESNGNASLKYYKQTKIADEI